LNPFVAVTGLGTAIVVWHSENTENGTIGNDLDLLGVRLVYGEVVPATTTWTMMVLALSIAIAGCVIHRHRLGHTGTRL
jgi:hypothetical protein